MQPRRDFKGFTRFTKLEVDTPSAGDSGDAWNCICPICPEPVSNKQSNLCSLTRFLTSRLVLDRLNIVGDDHA